MRLREHEGVRLEHRWLEEADIPAIFARTDICVLPYREASQSAVTASALAVGMPVVTTPLPSLVEQIGGGRAGVAAADFSPAAFARAVLDLVADPAEYRRLSQEAIAFSSFDAVVDGHRRSDRGRRARAARSGSKEAERARGMSGTALIFGISGQDGSLLARHLLDRGYTVHGTSRDAELNDFRNLVRLGIRHKVTGSLGKPHRHAQRHPGDRACGPERDL